jgi:hypothetical protein
LLSVKDTLLEVEAAKGKEEEVAKAGGSAGEVEVLRAAVAAAEEREKGAVEAQKEMEEMLEQRDSELYNVSEKYNRLVLEVREQGTRAGAKMLRYA